MRDPRDLIPSIHSFVDLNIAALRSLPVADLAQLRLTSWGRTPERNRQVGGSAESQHLFYLATDWTGISDRISFIRQMERQGLIAVDEGDHIHVQGFPAGSLRRWGFFA